MSFMLLVDTMSAHKTIRLALTWWATGGHVFPIASLIQMIDTTASYSKRVERIYRFGEKKKLEQKICDEVAQKVSIPTYFVPMLAGKIRRQSWIIALLSNLIDAWKVLVGIWIALVQLRRNKIDYVFCKWWYVAWPVVIAAKLLGIPIGVHESDTRPGMINRLAARFSQDRFVGFAGVLPDSTTVGQILSDELVPSDQQKTIFCDMHHCHLSSDKVRIMLMWWWQWSSLLTKTLATLIGNNPQREKQFEFFVVGGTLQHNKEKLFAGFSHVHYVWFLTQSAMGAMLSLCDIAITRAWTTSLAEQKLFGLSLCMIPLPITHDQYQNAQYYRQQYDDSVLDQEAPDFVDQLQQQINSYQWKKKSWYNDDVVLASIHQSKTTVLDQIFSHT